MPFTLLSGQSSNFCDYDEGVMEEAMSHVDFLRFQNQNIGFTSRNSSNAINPDKFTLYNNY